MIRFHAPRFRGMTSAPLIAAALLASTVVANDKPADPKTDEGTFSGTLYLIQNTFDPADTFGADVETDELREAIRKDGVPKAMGLYSDARKTAVLHRLDINGVMDVPSRVFIGDEIPYVTEYSQPDGAKSYTTQTLACGLTADFTIQTTGDDKLRIDHEVDFDQAIPDMAKPGLIGRIRLNWTGTCIVDDEKPVLIGRFSRELDDVPVEYLFVMILEVDD